MKNERHLTILKIIEQNVIDTQDDLMKKLNDLGYSVTQATVSRDIKELRLFKSHDTDGYYRYLSNSTNVNTEAANSFQILFKESVMKLDYAENIVVIKCYTGMANAVCASLDKMELTQVVGTLAGDDTIFCLMKTKKDSRLYVERLTKLLL